MLSIECQTMVCLWVTIGARPKISIYGLCEYLVCYILRDPLHLLENENTFDQKRISAYRCSPNTNPNSNPKAQ